MRWLFALFCLAMGCADAAGLCTQYRSILIREAHAVFGLNAPIPMFAGQITQESACRANVTALDLGRGLAQFMDGTTKQVSRSFPELGAPDPYNPAWAIRALVRFDRWLYERVKGDTVCDRWAAALKGYNAGLGFVQRAQRQSPKPGVWFGATEMVNAGQSARNFEYSRMYPRWVMIKHQPGYSGWGAVTCDGVR